MYINNPKSNKSNIAQGPWVSAHDHSNPSAHSSEMAQSFVKWAQTHSLAEIAAKSAQILSANLSAKVSDPAMISLAVMSIVSAVFHDPRYRTTESKKAHIHALISEVAGGAPGWTMFMHQLARVLHCDFVSEFRTIHNASVTFADMLDSLYGQNGLSDIRCLTPRHEGGSKRIKSGFNREALDAINTLVARFPQARLREEIYREAHESVEFSSFDGYFLTPSQPAHVMELQTA